MMAKVLALYWLIGSGQQYRARTPISVMNGTAKITPCLRSGWCVPPSQNYGRTPWRSHQASQGAASGPSRHRDSLVKGVTVKLYAIPIDQI